MRRVRGPRRGWAKITLGVSLLFAVGVFVFLSIQGSPVRGAAGGLLIIVAGLWEWRRKRSDQIRAERFEAEAEESQRKRQG
ncbi:hypothetical protein ZOD2009_17643 [Haladaptatus paucihalophilus DX253]|uniref:Uncharacterized protein n=1 Tax=Haladaptatus paucihalophilus DX253 TaxID=797209 RepID=E7QXJ0_HALPU|nr:hypothetical protein [Haladaptatus paucihalophilus]EFW90993.1 hypothetical protein ZOD2009_17643 [Haladaptatus paucihalophilus DX253]SHK28616.1 hypothetical protein SAMN05444342_1205 [Haladaptatus paucihalophilus DX253]